MSKRTLDSFFSPPAKKSRPDTIQIQPSSPPPDGDSKPQPKSNHSSYPWPVPHLPTHIQEELEMSMTAQGKEITNQPHLDLVYFQPFVPKTIERELFEFLRSELFFYRVKYTITRFGKSLDINTPRYTSVFGLDETARFVIDDAVSGGEKIVETADPTKPIKKNRYKAPPRPIPECLDFLRRVTEANTNTNFNFCLVNYYATGSDSISYHSDDEYFLGHNPAIASFSLGAKRDFLMKHKPSEKNGEVVEGTSPIKLALGSGDMILMRGETQSNWMHSIPKRKGVDADKGRINITLRRAMIPAGTDNYYRYNVGDGDVYKWSKQKKEMLPWSGPI